METEKLIEALRIAKDNVRWLLDNSEGLADMHNIEYWATRVEELRKEIKNNL